MPPPGHPNTMSQDLRPSQLPNKPLDRRSNLSQHNIIKPPMPAPSVPVEKNSSFTQWTNNSQPMAQNWNDPYDGRTLDLSNYPAPHPASPLSKHLNKLLPPN